MAGGRILLRSIRKAPCRLLVGARRLSTHQTRSSTSFHSFWTPSLSTGAAPESMLSKSGFTSQFRGQLAPPRVSPLEEPARPRGSTFSLGLFADSDTGPVFAFLDEAAACLSDRFLVSAQCGPYGSVFLRVHEKTGSSLEDIGTCARTVECAVGEIARIQGGKGLHALLAGEVKETQDSDAKSLADSEKDASFAIYVVVQASSAVQCAALLPRMTTAEKSSLLSRFRFHHTRDGDELVYYSWFGPALDRVPPYASSNGGVGVILFNRDFSKILLVHEYGVWKPVTGLVGPAESKLAAAQREVKEEVGLDMDASGVVFVGGWQSGGNWDKVVNDEFSMLVGRIRVNSSDDDENPVIKVDGEEILEAKWVDTKILKDKVKEEKVLEEGKYMGGIYSGKTKMTVEIEGVGKIVPKLLRWLDRFWSKKGLEVMEDGGRVYWN